MRHNKYLFYFYNWVARKDSEGIQITASNYDEALILAQAERIKSGKQYKTLKSKYLWDFEASKWVKV